jgi:hypothetical protein
VINPFALNNLVNVAGISPGARVGDPVSEEIFLRPRGENAKRRPGRPRNGEQ